jgi:lipoprotein NlpD
VIEPGQLLRVDVRNAAGGTLAAAPQATAPQATAVGTATTTAVAIGTGIQRAPLESQPMTRQQLPSTPLPTTAPPAQVPTTPPATTTVTPPPIPAPAQTARVEPPAPQRSEPVVAVPPASTAPVTAPAVIEPPSQTPPPSAPVDPNAPIQWDWPARGNIIGRYSNSDPDNKGIKLGGNEGDTVMAAADGEVVYTGNGLLRYGELVILKHNDHFLSAYAHNKLIAVKEGDRVTRGQKIAELGSTGIDRDMLHFEIRLDGKPVDPMTYLPAR